MLASEIKDGEARVAAQRDAAALKKAELAKSLQALQAAQGRLLGDRLDWVITDQRDVEEAALRLTKNVNSLYQRAAKWKAEQRRFRAHLEGLDKFADWAVAAEADLRAIAGNLEYVSAVLEKESETPNTASVEPARGRLMMFTSGKENLHQVKQVESDTRYVMSMWFSCGSRKQFHNFLDGKMHQHFIREDM